MVEHLLVVRWVLGLIPHSGPIKLFLVPASAHDWYNKDCGMCYPVCGMVLITDPLLLIGKSSP